MKMNPASMLLAITTVAILLMNPADAFLMRQKNRLDYINNPTQTKVHIDRKRIKNEKEKIPVLKASNIVRDSILDMCAVLVGRLIIG
ncbi:predicted protein [Chaetoceros tenuissimus]|uniref:Uncharacterized protein n=1 Tax=Chaetoceros tenuissimus TaxID=426638 RepID=A0AAD3CFA7_9STRA|nr:predicted protein [Chaetoceros tenuissimus]